jgi:membrane-associated phospholipid phosphatase
VFRLGLHRWLLLPLVALLGLPIVLVGPVRILREVHWSADVVGAYLLAVASVIVLVLVLEIGERWFAGRGLFRASVRPALAPSTPLSR